MPPGTPVPLPDFLPMKLKLLLVFGLACTANASSALAKGDAEAGKLRVYTCSGCHGIPGYKNVYPHYHVPRIAGQNYEYLIAALNAYQKGDRKHPTMRAHAESFSAQDIDDIATYLSSLAAEGAQK
jgi:cytochrome c553